MNILQVRNCDINHLKNIYLESSIILKLLNMYKLQLIGTFL